MKKANAVAGDNDNKLRRMFGEFSSPENIILICQQNI